MSEWTRFFGPDGVLAQRISGFEPRAQQLAMAEAVDQAFKTQQHAIIEAPTGVGKSFAYLEPAVQQALRSGEPVVIATATIALQEQLLTKDLPIITAEHPNVKVALAKGRQNYVCHKRLGFVLGHDRGLLASREDAAEVRRIAGWVSQGGSCDRRDLGFEPSPSVWRLVMSDHTTCKSRRCPNYEECGFYLARKKLLDANIIVANHHLYFSNLALKDEHGAILPPHTCVVFDEAHNVEDSATEHLGLGITQGQVRWVLDQLLNKAGQGLLSFIAQESGLGDAVDRARAANQEFWDEVRSWVQFSQTGRGRGGTQRIREPHPFPDVLSAPLLQLAEALAQQAGKTNEKDAGEELKAQAARCVEMANAIRAICGLEVDGKVCFALVQNQHQASLHAQPLEIGAVLKEMLFSPMKSVILTSATLAADDSERFLFLRRRIGLEGGLAKRLDSPFDYKSQARLLLNRTPVDPNSPEFERAMAQWVGEYLETAHGGTFLLFTSYRQMEAVHALLQPRLERMKRFILKQGERIGRTEMLDLFRATGDAVLFGTSSFWEGVDVKGSALSHVIIAKIPFETPDHPVVEARLDAIKRQGGNPFMERSVPEAILRLKQGVGRLIRSKTDTGSVVILDHRISTSTYGRYFIRALPPMQQEDIFLAQTLRIL
jgi:ATP-dependent DNA helicase DinG